MARNSENIAGAISAVNNIVSTQTEALAQIKKNLAKKAAGATDISLGITSAAVGDIVKVKAVDASGKPTEWEAADGGTMQKLGEWSVPEGSNVQVFEQEYDLASLQKFTIILKMPIVEDTSKQYRAYIKYGTVQQYYIYAQKFSATKQKLVVIEYETYGGKFAYKCYVKDSDVAKNQYGFANASSVSIGMFDNSYLNPANAVSFGVDMKGEPVVYLDGMTAELWGVRA